MVYPRAQRRRAMFGASRRQIRVKTIQVTHERSVSCPLAAAISMAPALHFRWALSSRMAPTRRSGQHHFSVPAKCKYPAGQQ